MARFRPDVCHAFLPQSCLTAGLAALVVRPRLLAGSRRSLNLYQAERPRLSMLERWTMRRMDVAIGNSRAVAEDLKKDGVIPARLGLIYNGVDTAPFDAAPSRAEARRAVGVAEDSFVMVCVANLIPYKGHADLLAALAQAAGRLPAAWVLLLAGRDDGIGAGLAASAHACGLDGHIRILGHVEDIPLLLRAADVALLPSHEEGFSNSILEAMAASLPVVATRVGGNPEAVADGLTGILVPPHQPALLAEAMLTLAGDPVRSRTMGQRGRRRLEENFSLADCLGRYERLYADFLAGKGLPADMWAEPPPPQVFMSEPAMNILFVARSLLRGGAERQLVALATALRARGHRVTVALFYVGDPLIRELETAGIPVLDLAKRSRWDLTGPLRRLAVAIRRLRPDVVHGYLPTGNVLALAAARMAGLGGARSRVVFGIRAGDMRLGCYGWAPALPYMAEAALARFADFAIANSQAGKARALSMGFAPDKATLIDNGIDTDRFCPNTAKRAAFRDRMGIGDGDSLIGMVGRLDPMKDHRTFLRAAALLHAERPKTRFVCIGDGDETLRRQYMAEDAALGLGEALAWLPGCDPIEDIYPGLDLLVSSSAFGEGFSNVLGEAMACGVACVATDVGEASRVIGDTGLVVPCGDAKALARAALQLLDGPDVGHSARQRVVALFSLDRLADATEAVLADIAGPARPCFPTAGGRPKGEG